MANSTVRIPVAERELKKNQLRLNSRQILEAATAIKAKKGDAFRMTDVALQFIPKDYKWFENGADCDLAIWLTKILETAVKRGKHVIAIYTLPKQGNC